MRCPSGDSARKFQAFSGPTSPQPAWRSLSSGAARLSRATISSIVSRCPPGCTYAVPGVVTRLSSYRNTTIAPVSATMPTTGPTIRPVHKWIWKSHLRVVDRRGASMNDMRSEHDVQRQSERSRLAEQPRRGGSGVGVHGVERVVDSGVDGQVLPRAPLDAEIEHGIR